MSHVLPIEKLAVGMAAQFFLVAPLEIFRVPG